MTSSVFYTFRAMFQLAWISFPHSVFRHGSLAFGNHGLVVQFWLCSLVVPLSRGE